MIGAYLFAVGFVGATLCFGLLFLVAIYSTSIPREG